MKRYLICLLGGFIAAGVCVFGMMSSAKIQVTTPIILATAGNRILIGFVLGISGWRVHWTWHGIMVGLIVTLSSAVAILPEWQGFIDYTLAGMVYGFLIEWTATKIFRQPVSS